MTTNNHEKQPFLAQLAATLLRGAPQGVHVCGWNASKSRFNAPPAVDSCG
jgi:hypothetical protein